MSATLPIKLSKRARSTPASPIRRLAGYSRAAAEAGTKVHFLNIGQPDIPTPSEFFDGLRKYPEGTVAYERSEGNLCLRKEWADQMNRDYGLSLQPESFLVCTGASEALIFTFMITCDPGDEILIFDPTYANYIGFAAISGVDLIPLVTTLESGFALPEVDLIEKNLSSRTRAILLCNPNNPTGTVYTEEELKALIDLCERHNIFLVVDEAYREFVYDGLEATSIFQLAPNNDNIIVIDSLSKRYSLCGARLGALITVNERVIKTGLALAQARLASPTIEQMAAAHMLQEISPSYLQGVRAEYEARRDALCNRLAAIEGVEFHKPHGAFYTVARLPLADAAEFAKFMLTDFRQDDQTVFMAPAFGFYQSRLRGRNKVRIASVVDSETLELCAGMLDEGIKQWKALGH